MSACHQGKNIKDDLIKQTNKRKKGNKKYIPPHARIIPHYSFLITHSALRLDKTQKTKLMRQTKNRKTKSHDQNIKKPTPSPSPAYTCATGTVAARSGGGNVATRGGGLPSCSCSCSCP